MKPRLAPQLSSSWFNARRQFAAILLAAALELSQLKCTAVDGHFDYRYEAYREDGPRINIDTHSFLFEVAPESWLDLKGQLVFDAISGASPTGSPPPSQVKFVPPDLGGPTGPFSTSVPLGEMHDSRRAFSLAPTFSLGIHHLTPEFSYSEESDYISRGVALTYSVDLFQKNTTLNFGVSGTKDRVLPKGFLTKEEHKDAQDIMVGVNQLLGPKTVATLNLSVGSARGYLNDQYKGVYFVNDVPQLSPESPSLEKERRPTTRNHYSAYAALTQYVPLAQASVEGSYRFFNDTYGIAAHTVTLAWNQKVGSRVLISPTFRYYNQSAADFYAPFFPDFAHAPEFYSADYRLSHMETLMGGLTISVRATDWLSFDAGYKRYVMNGLDHVTSQTAYPNANIFTIGARIWF